MTMTSAMFFRVTMSTCSSNMFAVKNVKFRNGVSKKEPIFFPLEQQKYPQIITNFCVQLQ